MKLSREAIQRMISQKPGTSNVTVINQEGGGGVTLGPLLTSLNAEAMPTAEGYLHWTGSDWDFTSIDLSSYATEAWVLQQGYVTSSAISDMATETWVLQQGYITASAVSNAWKVKDVEVVADNGLVLNGEDVIYDAVLASNGMLTLKSTRLSIAVPEYTSDLVNDSGFIDQTFADGRYLPLSAGGSTPLTGSLFWNVANQTDNLIISNNKIQLSVSGTPHNIVLFEGSTASLTSYAKFYERPMVKTGMNSETPVYTNVALVSEVEAKQNIIHFFNTKDSNAEVFFSNIYLPLNYQLGGTVYLDLSDYATTSALSGYLPLTGGSLSNDLTIASNKYLRFGSNSGGLLIHNTTNGNNSLDISANRINLNVENGLFYNGEEVSTHSAIQNEFVAKAGSSMTGALSMGNGVNVNFGDCSVTSNGSAQGNIQAGKILKLMGNYVAVTAGDNADANFTVNGNIVATRTWVGNGWKVKDVEIVDDDSVVVNGDEVFYGAQFTTNGMLTLARARLSIYEPEYISDLINDSGFISQTFADGRYLPLTAGSSKPLTGSLYVTPGAGTHQAVEVRGSQYYIGLAIGSGNVNRGLYGDTIGISDGWLLYFDANNTILNYGNVGIGTTTPQAKLDVNGSVVIAGALAGVTNIDGLMIFDSTNAQVSTRYINIGEEYYRMSIYADDEAAKFDGATDGAYYFLNGGSTPNGSIYAGSGNFSGNLTAGNRPSDADQKLYVGGSAVITGSMGIGTRPTGNYAVEVDGSVYASSSVHADSFVNNSDIRMKDVTRFIEPSVHDIAIAPIIEFKWKNGDGSKNLGTIAQYWQTVFPQAVHEGGDGMLSIEYANIALASAITAARKAVDNERRIAELELRVAELEDELAAMVSQQSETTDN